jgi:hypothetical protein
MIDPERLHDPCVVIDLVHNPVRSATRRPQASELTLEGVPDAAWSIGEGAEHELDDRRRDALR